MEQIYYIIQYDKYTGDIKIKDRRTNEVFIANMNVFMDNILTANIQMIGGFETENTYCFNICTTNYESTGNVLMIPKASISPEVFHG